MLAQRVVTARVLLSSVVHLHPNLFGLTLTWFSNLRAIYTIANV